MSMIYRFFVVVIAAASLLLGAQAPNFVDQYEKRLDAHLSEAGTRLRGFQEIADKFFSGSLAALLDKHEQSSDEVFRAEATPLRVLFNRYQRFNRDRLALETTLPGKVYFIVAGGDPQLTRETWANYSFAVPLNGAAATSGLITMVLVVLLVVLLKSVICKAAGISRRQQQSYELRL